VFRPAEQAAGASKSVTATGSVTGRDLSMAEIKSKT
jgi:hypothetical protein